MKYSGLADLHVLRKVALYTDNVIEATQEKNDPWKVFKAQSWDNLKPNFISCSPRRSDR